MDNRRDIKALKSDATQIDITDLPIEDYPFLSKFSRVRVVVFWSNEGRGATDEKLKALASLGFTNLIDIGLVNARSVTDEGIRALADIKSLRLLALEGTSITDRGLEIMTSRMRLDGVNVSNCRGVTKKGIEHLTDSSSLKHVSFSADTLSQDDVLEVLGRFRTNVTYLGVLDLDGKLHQDILIVEGAKRQIQVVIKRKGALQSFGLDY